MRSPRDRRCHAYRLPRESCKALSARFIDTSERFSKTLEYHSRVLVNPQVGDCAVVAGRVSHSGPAAISRQSPAPGAQPPANSRRKHRVQCRAEVVPGDVCVVGVPLKCRRAAESSAVARLSSETLISQVHAVRPRYWHIITPHSHSTWRSIASSSPKRAPKIVTGLGWPRREELLGLFEVTGQPWTNGLPPTAAPV